jgi:1-acyl-sn-glycerol-3-phosphate acyltransferase
MPGVGQIMVLSGHILLDRGGKESIKQMFRDCKQRLSIGSNIFIFPQGTRERTVTLPFKHGAFSLAESEEVDIIPVSIKLSDKAWKRLPFYGLLWGAAEAKEDPAARLTVHERIRWDDYKDGKNGGKEGMNAEAFKRVYSCLPELPMGEHEQKKKK